MSKRYPCARCGTSPEGCAACPQVAEHYVMERHQLREGSRVRFVAHGETGLIHTVVTREGDDCDLCDPRGRILPRVPLELLVLAPVEPKLSAIRAVDELR